MIYAKMSADRSIYPEAIQKALDFLNDHDISKMEPGRYPILGDKMFAVVVDVELARTEQVKPEAHKTYIDVQYWQDHVTRFGMFPLTEASVVKEARPDNDVWYYETEADESFLVNRPNSFAIFFPSDVHRPDLCVDEPKTIRKCVVKIDVQLLAQKDLQF